MANYSELLNDINAAIYENNDQEIDALEVRAILREMVTSLGSGFLFKGIATPSSPGTSQAPDQNVFYLATTAGTYTYLGGLVVAAGEVAFLCYDGTWTKKSSALLSTGSIVDNTTTEDATKPLSAKQGKVLADAEATTAAEVTALGQEVGTNKDNITNLQQEIDSIQPIIIEGNVTNAPDEEDITTDSNDLLKFADRPTAVNQMGYVILRKNKTFAEQVTKENTIYEIRYPFDLGGASVTIPAGCVLKFVGGAIDNGEIVGTDSTIDAPVSKIFGSDVTIGGTWANPYAYADWFDSIQKAIDAFLVIKLSPRSYDLDEGLELRAFSRIIGADSKLNFSIGNNGIAIKIGSQSRVENVYIRLVRGVGTDRVGVLFDADYMATTRSNSSGYYSTIRRVPQLYMLENVEIENPESPSTGAYADTAISIRATNSGFWGNIARNVRIFGAFLYGIDIDSNVGSLSSDSGWLTNLTFRDFIFANCLVGVNIHKTNASASSSRLTRTLFDNFHFQAVDVTKRNEYKELGIVSRFATIDSAEGVTFTNWYVSDWANDESAACSSTALIHINPNNAIRISVDTSLWDFGHLLDAFRMVSWSALNNGLYYNCPQIDIANTEFSLNMSNYIDFDNETTNRILFLVEILPPMRYYVPKGKISSFITALGLSGLKADPQLLSVEIVPSSSRRQIIVYGHYDVAPSSGEFTTAKVTLPSRRTEDDYTNIRTRWIYSE
jgi:hypothetical protein